MSSGQPQRITSRDIAREAGVSQPTVSRALRGDPRVAPQTAKQVRETARRLGYVPHAAARSLITRRAGTVGIVVADLNNPFYPQLVEALREELGAARYSAVLVSERSRDREGDDLAALIGSGMIDGAIVATATTDRAERERLRDGVGPLVFLVRESPGADRDTVVADNRGGGSTAARYIAGLGHTRIGRISGPPNTSTARERDRGLEEGLVEAGVEPDPGLCRRGAYSHASGYSLCRALLSLRRAPTAIFCGNDVIALGALDAARELGVAVPGELSIIGFDDIAMAGWASFALTTVHQPLTEMARAAARLLVGRIEGEREGGPERVVFPTHLVERATAAPPTGPPL